MTGFVMTVPDHLSKESFIHGLVHEANRFRPDFVEEHATDSRRDHTGFFIPVYRVTPVIRVLETDPVMNLHNAFIVSGMNLECVGHDRQMLNFIRLPTRTALEFGTLLIHGVHGQVVHTQSDILRRCHDRLTAGR